jgi:hypothetical protein
MNESLKTLDTNALIAPPYPSAGTDSGTIVMENSLAENAATNVYTPAASPTIGGYAAVALDGNTGYGSWTNVPHPPTALWARVGDVLQLAVVNKIGGAGTPIHPYHLHGFSMQPMYIMSANLLTNLYTFNYNEFLDTIEVYPGTAIVFRIRLTDRPTFADTATGGPVTLGASAPSGGALGRWLMHCHIFLHTTIGMITELNVVPNPPTLIGAQMLSNGVLQFDFTNANPGASYSVLFTTNLAVPLADWTVIGAASNISPGVLQFTDTNATNSTRFYAVRSP